MKRKIKSPAFHYYFSSSSDDDFTEPNVTPPPPPPPPYNVVNDPLAPRTPLGATTSLYYETIPASLCSDTCNGVTPTACLSIHPQCFGNGTGSDSERNPPLWMGINNQLTIRPLVPTPPIITLNIYWLITPYTSYLNLPEFPPNSSIPYDFHFKSAVQLPATLQTTASISLYQDKAGTWVQEPESAHPNNTLTSSTDIPKQSVTLTDDYGKRINNNYVKHVFAWQSTGGQIIYYNVYKFYGGFATPVPATLPQPEPFLPLQIVTLPSDCLLFHDNMNHPTEPILENCLAQKFNGCPEVFLSSVLAPPDSWVTLDNRSLPEFGSTFHRNLKVRIPSWGNSTNTYKDVTHNVIVVNNTDRSLTIGIQNSPTQSVTASIPVGNTTTLTATVTHRANISNPPYTRLYHDLFYPASNFNTGFIDVNTFTTQIPTNIKRRIYSIRDVCTKAWDVTNTELKTLARVPPADLRARFTDNGGFQTSRFGNVAGFQNAWTILECKFWYNNWQHFIGSEDPFSTLPPLNLVFDGDIRISTTLQGLTNQFVDKTLSSSFGNPYDGDTAKNGIISLGTGTDGVKTLTFSKAMVTFYISRDLTVNSTTRLFRFVTLN